MKKTKNRYCRHEILESPQFFGGSSNARYADNALFAPSGIVPRGASVLGVFRIQRQRFAAKREGL